MYVCVSEDQPLCVCLHPQDCGGSVSVKRKSMCVCNICACKMEKCMCVCVYVSKCVHE